MLALDGLRAMSAVEQVRQRLANYPHVRYKAGPAQITILPSGPAGFAISLAEAPGRYTVAFEGWHEEFTSEAEALECLSFGLSDACRLRVERRGAVAYRWTVEARDGDRWREDSTTGLLLFPFWRRRTVEYRQNALIRADGRAGG